MNSTNRFQNRRGGQPISQQIAQRLVSQKKKYFKAKQQFITNFDYDDCTEYYLLASKFINEWKQYTAYDQNNISILPSTGVPPQQYNTNLINSTKGESLKPGLVEGQDYEIVSSATMNVFNSYKGKQIQKQAVKLSNGKKIVEVYGLQFNFFFLSQKIVNFIDTKKLFDFQVQKSCVSRYYTIRNFKKAFIRQYQRIYKQAQVKDIKIWKMNKNINLKKYFDYVKNKASRQNRDNYKLQEAHAILFDKFDSMIEDMAIANDDILIVEVQQSRKQWVISEGSNEDQCQYCRKYQVLTVECECKKAKYCSTECQSKDIVYHRRKCDMVDEMQLKQEVSFEFTKNSRKGICGLSNLGNTCFMNSCLQCLSNTISLTQYFISKKYVNEINKSNPIGTKGKLTVKYAKMIQALWCQDSESFSPSVLKSGISDFQPMFSGYSQHDSQQLLSFLLDGLHQDLNRVINKPYVESVDYKEGEPQENYAFQSWKRYLMRNKSVIVDLFMGQYKSKVICPDCKFQSLTFDPYSTVSLPIPHVTKVTIQAFVFYSNHRELTKKISIDASIKSIKALKQDVLKTLGLDPNLIGFYSLSFDGQCQQFNADNNIDKIISNSSYNKQQIFVVERSKQQQAEIKNSVLIYVKIVIDDGRSFDAVTFKRPLFWKLHKLYGQQIYRRVFAYLFQIVLSRYFNVSVNSQKPEVINKYFEKAFESSTKSPFQIFLMTQPIKAAAGKSSQIKYSKQVLIQMNTPVHDVLLDNSGRLKKIEFEVRLRRDIKEYLKPLNTFEDQEKNKKGKNDEDDSKSYSLADCFKQFQKIEKLQVGNQWRCPKCQDFKLAYKSMSLYKTPKVLILHLKRFKQKSTYSKSKLNSLVNFPLDLDLDNYVMNKTLPQAYFKNEIQGVNTTKSTRYELFAVSNHYGGMGGGHYTAYAKNKDVWYDFNDSSVHKVKSSEVISSAAYMLFYKRID